MKMKKLLSVLCALILLSTTLSCLAFAEETPKLYVALGDSIAAGTRLYNANVQCYGAMISKTAGWDFMNLAVPGHTTYAFSQRLDNEQVKEAVSKADIITVSIGGNNYLLGGMPQMIQNALVNNDYSQMDEVIQQFYVSFDECIQKIKVLNPTAELFVETLYNPMPGKIGEVYAQGQQRLNNAYKQYLTEHPDAYTLVDIEPLFAGHADYIASDFIHPNKTGHIVIANAYMSTMHEMGLCEQDTVVEPTFGEIYVFNLVEFFKDLIFRFTNAIHMLFGKKA